MDLAGVGKTYVRNMGKTYFANSVNYMKQFKKNNIDEKTILYESMHGKGMNDSPYAFFKYLMEKPEFSEYKHIWVLNDRENNQNYEFYKHYKNVKFINTHTKEYFKYLSSSKYLINSVSFPEYFIKKDEQIYINTWHGTPLKTLGKDMGGKVFQHANLQRNFLKANYIISPNEFSTEKLLASHDMEKIFEGQVIEKGYPRIDSTLQKSIRTEGFLTDYLHIDLDKEIVLYAPTWRGEVGEVQEILSDIVPKIAEISQGLKSSQTLIVKAHTLIYEQLKNADLPVQLIPNWIDTNELLYFVDILITDYSSIFFDFLVTDRPVIYYMYDKEQYIEERGVYLDLDNLPGPVYRTAKEVINGIKSKEYLNEKHLSVYKKFKEKFSSHENGRVTEYCVNKIFLEEKVRIKDTTRKNILVYGGGMLNNGITASLINLSHSIDYQKYNLIIIDAKKNSEEFQDNIRKLNKNTVVMYRSGYIQHTYKEWIYYNRFFRKKEVEDSKLSIYQTLFDRELKRLIGDVTIDVVIDFSGYVPFWSFLLSMVTVPKKIIYQHSDMLSETKKVVNGKKNHELNLTKVFILYKYFNYIASVGENTLKINKNNFSHITSKDKFVYIPNAMNVDKLFEHRKNPKLHNIKVNENELMALEDTVNGGMLQIKAVKPIKEDEINFINIGRLSPEKDQEKLLMAFAKLVNKFPKKKMHLYIVGSGVLENKLKNITNMLSLERHVTFVGQTDSVFELLDRCDCFVFSSNHEGQPMTLLESLALGKDIIATDIPGNRSVLGNSYGYIVENSVEGLCVGMGKYLNHEIIFNKDFDVVKYNEEALKTLYKYIENKN
ncbi:glycosyltransferase [Vagococcus acidifermentans]|uniref:Glycosyl transferase family 1 domain-containing protein n=1 Tax=Vagococcus acidifermentans TaxID=564710 RepID=A0A430AQ93_9ENTE|nr:glycosyltransferase [Vagococcus acidifermentans]RSU10067.1 hypothetical protein CBF27_11110 [Vagococcus acidifermentans]